MNISNKIKKLFWGSDSSEAYKPNSFYRKQVENIKSIWNNKTYNDFGLERVLRIFLGLTSFIIPSGLVRELSGTKNLLVRKINIELFGIIKILLLYSILKFHWTTNTTLLWVSIIFTADTLHFLTSRIFLTDVFRAPISNRRSLIMVFVNYIEICLCFAFIYAYIDQTNTIQNKIIFTSVNEHITSLQAIYFSFVTSATLGYGDIVAKDPFVMKIVILQVIISLFLVVVIISNVTTKIDEDTFYNKKKKQNNS